MNDKILWDIIDRLRDELNIASDGIVDLNDVVRDLQAESIEQIKDNKELKAENERLKKCIWKLKAEIKELKAELDKAENFRQVMYNDMDAEIRKLKEDNNKHYPKEYKAEAEEYFHHNPKGEKLFFFIVGDDEIDEDGDVTRTLNVGCDSIAEIDNMEIN